MYEERLVPIPDHLLLYPCDVVGPGKTSEDLNRAYVKNTTCVGKYRGVMDGIIQYNKQISPEGLGEGEGKNGNN